MASAVLILATRYDCCTFYTYSWALELQADLLRRGHTSLMLDVEAICHSGATIADSIERVDYVVFFGHGHSDQWIAVPSGSAASTVADIPVITSSNVAVLDGKDIYAGCCHSLSQLGRNFANQCTGNFVGYSQQFQFETTNHANFRDVVNPSIVAFVSGTAAGMVAKDLSTEWDSLRHDFANGRLRHQPNAIMAAQCADDNSHRIGNLP